MRFTLLDVYLLFGGLHGQAELENLEALFVATEGQVLSVVDKSATFAGVLQGHVVSGNVRPRHTISCSTGESQYSRS